MIGAFPGGSAGQDNATTGQRSGTGREAATGGPAGTTAGGSGDYSLDNLPGSIGDSGSGPLTAAERAAILEGQLNRGYEEFDGVILAERARAQAQAAAARNPEIPGDADSGGGGGGGGPIIIASRQGDGSPQGQDGIPGAGGGPSAAQQEQTFPPPEDIPSGRDDDIVARQLREAAMHEPDPVLREALWDEYRKYTGIGN